MAYTTEPTYVHVLKVDDENLDAAERTVRRSDRSRRIK
jgi:hypothetical protein